MAAQERTGGSSSITEGLQSLDLSGKRGRLLKNPVSRTSINIGKAPENYIVLPFYGTGALFYLVLCCLLLLATGDWSGHYFTPHLLGIVHTAALGWGTMVIFGSAYQLLPVICERDLFSPRIALLSYGCLTAGVGLLVPAFWWFRPDWMMLAGGALIVCAAALYGINAWGTMGVCKRYSVQRLFILSSAIWLLITTLAGLLLAINLGHPFIFRNHLDLLKLHAHAGLAGWFLQLITGVSVKLVPMFLLGRSTKSRLLYISFGAQNAGVLLFIINGLADGPRVNMLVSGGLIALGVITWMIWLADVFRNRARKALDWPMKHVFLSFGCLLAAFALVPVMYFGRQPKWVLVYGLFLFAGWITSIILGMTFKTLPFIVWNGRYKHLNGKIKVPMPKHLYKEKWVSYQFAGHLAGMILLALGVALQRPGMIRVSLWVTMVAACIYVGNVMRVLFHKVKVPAHGAVHS